MLWGCSFDSLTHLHLRVTFTVVRNKMMRLTPIFTDSSVGNFRTNLLPALSSDSLSGRTRHITLMLHSLASPMLWSPDLSCPALFLVYTSFGNAVSSSKRLLRLTFNMPLMWQPEVNNWVDSCILRLYSIKLWNVVVLPVSHLTSSC